jgi:hypothetical protein
MVTFSSDWAMTGFDMEINDFLHEFAHQLPGSNSLFLKSSITAWPESTSILLKFLPGLPWSPR